MSFWSADEKVPVQQTRVSIPAENGLDYIQGQKINLHIPPTIKYFQPKESYLRMDVELDASWLDHPCKLHLDDTIGAQVLIRDIRIHSGGSGAVLLEEIQNYNVLTAVKYDYESNDAIRNKRAMTEGSLVYNPEQRGTQGTSKTPNGNTRRNPYYNPYGVATENNQTDGKSVTLADDKNWGSDPDKEGFNLVKVLLPLNTGIFQSPKVFPTLLTEGLRIEIILEDAKRVYRMPDTLALHRRKNYGLRFHSLTGKDDDRDTDSGNWFNDTDSSGADQPSDTDVLFFTRDNNQINLQNCPVVIGQKIQLARSEDFDDLPSQPARIKTDREMIVKDIEFKDATGVGDQEGGNYGLLKITLTQTCTRKKLTGSGVTDARVNGAVDSDWFLVDDSVRDSKTTGTELGNAPTSDLVPKYKVKNVEMILQTLTMPQGYTQKLMSMMGTGGAMNYDFLSYTNYKYSQNKADRVANIRLPLNQTKAKSILCVPTDASVYSARKHICLDDDSRLNDAGYTYAGTYQDTYPSAEIPDAYTYVDIVDLDGAETHGDIMVASNRAGLVGIWDELSDYQLFYNGQLNPSRKVECDKISVRSSVQQQPLIELEKALAMAGIQPLSFTKFRENCVIGRALALQQGVYNTAGRDFNLQVNYQMPVAPVKPKLWNNYVAHIRRLVVQGNQVAIQV